MLSRLEFGNSFNPNPKIVLGNGDDYVNQRSLAGCSRWENDAQKNKIYQKEFPGLDHITILDDFAPVKYIIETLMKEYSGDAIKKS